MKKTAIALMFIISAVLSLITFESATAQTPATPTYNVKAISSSYEVPTIYSTDPYTGATITKDGYTANSINITFTINNSPNTSFFLLQLKGHYTPEWSTLYEDGYNITMFASSGPKTIFKIFGSNVTTNQGGSSISPKDEITFYFSNHWKIDVPLGSQIDFRLQAVSGSLWVDPLYGANYQLAVGETSDWSDTQTITIHASSSSATPSPEPTTVGETFPASLVFVASVGIALAVIGLFVYFKKHK